MPAVLPLIIMNYDAILLQPRAGRLETIGVRPPDSLLSIAAVPHSKDQKIKIIDTRISRGWKQELLGLLKNSNPLCVGVTCMTGVQIKYALEIGRFVKENSSVPVIFGGVHPTFLPEQTLASRYVDIVISGEGDYALFEIISCLKRNKSLSSVRGIYYKEDGKVRKTPVRELIRNLDELPALPYDLIDVNAYYGLNLGDGGKSITMITSRGCPFRCTFCYNTRYYRNTWRPMSAKKVLERMKYLVKRYGIKTFYFHDDNFSVDLKRVDAIARGIIDFGLKVSWGLLGTRIDTLARMDDSFLERLRRAGCVNIDIGIESGSRRILELIKKKINLDEVISVNRKLARHGFITKYTFIVGFPSETEEEVMQSVKLALRLSEENPHAYTPFFIFTLYPGTEIFDLAVKHGYRTPSRLEGWITSNYEQAYLSYPWLSKKMIKIIRNLEFTSNFANRNIKYKIDKPFVRFLFDLYCPLAKLRFRHNFYFCPVERMLIQMLK